MTLDDNKSPSPRQEAQLQQAITFHQSGKLKEAYVLYEDLLKDFPNFPFLLTQFGTINLQTGWLERGVQLLGRSIELVPDQIDALSNRGYGLAQLNRFDEAVMHFGQAIAINPNIAELFFFRGNALETLQRLNEALSDYETAISIRPDYAEAYNNRGTVLRDLGRLNEALESYDRAIVLNPDYAEVYSNRGIVLRDLERLGEALESYDQAVTLKPDHPEAHNNRGNTLRDLGRLSEALESYDQAIALKPNYAEAYCNRGTVLRDLGRLGEALTDFEIAISFDADLAQFPGYLHTKMLMCNWKSFDTLAAGLITRIFENKKTVNPFELLGVSDDAQAQKKCAELFADGRHTPTRGGASIRPPMLHDHDRIRIGYFSTDFHNHPTMHLMAELFEQHDRSRFSLTAFSIGPDSQDAWRNRAVSCFDRFLDVRDRSNTQIAELARELEIDIAVDLKGYTMDARPGIFAERAAPIQINFLGFPGTMGAKYIDYIIADRILIPEANQTFYTEKIVYLPNCYQPNETLRGAPNSAPERADFGLPDSGIVFCCFNNNFKILPEVFSAWIRILARVEGSVLWLFSSNPWTENNLRAEAESRGIDASRLIFAKFLPREEHLARIRLADLFLDTFPCNAHTTASDALRVGLPLLTRPGTTFASRVAASLLTAVEMPELIVTSIEEYEAQAIELGNDPNQLKQIKDKLSNNLPQSPLFAPALFATQLEDAYTAMYERHQAGKMPDHLNIGMHS